MGNCWVRQEANYVIEEKRSSLVKQKQLTNSMDTDATTTLDEPPRIGLAGARKVSTLVVGPGEEDLFSKKINIDSFEIEKVIGKGAYGKVYLATKTDTGKCYALKEIKKESINWERDKVNTIFERAILQNVKSPFIVNLHYAFQTPDKLYYVLDFWNGGDLFFHLKKKFAFSEKMSRFYAAELILALEELHRNNIIYRDLKPENILLDSDGHVKLTDFGLSKIMGKDDVKKKSYTFAGTPNYLAPEIITEKGYSKEVDWWSLGAILYEMLVGVQPFNHNNHQKILDNILFKDLRFPDTVSKNAKDLVSKLLERDPTKRLGWGPNGTEDIKSHKFFKQIDWQALSRKTIADDENLEKLAKKEIVAPFKPKTKYEKDSRNFDKEYTDQRVDQTEYTRKMSIKEKKNSYIRDFTYYHWASEMTDGKLDVEKILEANLNNNGSSEIKLTGNFDSILEISPEQEDEENQGE